MKRGIFQVCVNGIKGWRVLIVIRSYFRYMLMLCVSLNCATVFYLTAMFVFILCFTGTQTLDFPTFLMLDVTNLKELLSFCHVIH